DGAAARPEPGVAEERLEDVAQAAGPEPAEQVVGPAAATRAPQALDAVHVVAAPALGVAQRLVGHRHLLEPRLGLGVAAVGVGMQLPRQLAVGALDLVLG